MSDEKFVRFVVDPALISCSGSYGPICITGMCSPAEVERYTTPTPQQYTPPPRVWENAPNTVWTLTVEYRKPSQGDAGVLGTYRTHEAAKRALAARLERALTPTELDEGGVYTEDESYTISSQELGD